MKKDSIKNNIETPVKKNIKTLRGVVVSDKMKDTVVVEITRFVKHLKYKKYYKVSKKYKAHDANNTKKVGDRVEMVSCRPMSKDKHFIIV